MKIKDRGYWVSTLYKYQSLGYWLMYSIYFRTITFFSAANPAVHLGGMLDDRKSDIYDLVKQKYLPKTIKIIKSESDINQLMSAEGLNFPIIVKPNVGFKGFLVKKIDNIEELASIIPDFDDREILLQEYISLSHEFSVMCYYRKDIGHYRISSLVEKHLPHFIANGTDSIKKQIEMLVNPFLKKEWVLHKMRDRWDEVPSKGQIITLDHVGNYARGSKFESLNAYIDDDLQRAMNDFFSTMTGVNFGRLDVKAASLEALKKGEFKLLEINGAKAEPIHIYDPKINFIDIIKDISFHWNTLFHIVQENISQVKSPSSAEGIKSFRSLKKSVS